MGRCDIVHSISVRSVTIGLDRAANPPISRPSGASARRTQGGREAALVVPDNAKKRFIADLRDEPRQAGVRYLRVRSMC